MRRDGLEIACAATLERSREQLPDEKVASAGNRVSLEDRQGARSTGESSKVSWPVGRTTVIVNSGNSRKPSRLLA